MNILLFQFFYALWQFVRTVKLFKIPYGILNNFVVFTFSVISRFFNRDDFLKVPYPFRKSKYVIVYNDGSNCTGSQDILNKAISDGIITSDDVDGPPDWKKFTLKLRSLKGDFYSKNLIDSQLTNIIEMDPDYFCYKRDFVFPGFSIINPFLSNRELFNAIIRDRCNISLVFHERVLSIYGKSLEIDVDFLKMLSIIPLFAQAYNMGRFSYYFSLIILFIDQFSILFNKMFIEVCNLLVGIYRLLFMKIKSPGFRFKLAFFLSNFSSRLIYCDSCEQNFVKVKKGEVKVFYSPNMIPSDNKLIKVVDFKFIDNADVCNEIESFSFFKKDFNNDILHFCDSDWVYLYQKNIEFFISKVNNELVMFCQGLHCYRSSFDINILPNIKKLVWILGEYGAPIEVLRENGCAHSLSLSLILGNHSYIDSFCLVESMSNFIIAENVLDLNLMQQRVFETTGLNNDVKSVLFFHNRMFWGNKNNFPVLEEIINKKRGVNSYSLPNSQFKLYLSDVNHILSSFKVWFKIGNSDRYHPSRCLRMVENFTKNNTIEIRMQNAVRFKQEKLVHRGFIEEELDKSYKKQQKAERVST